MVLPDFEETRNSVFAGSMVVVTDCTAVGTMESRTNNIVQCREKAPILLHFSLYTLHSALAREALPCP